MVVVMENVAIKYVKIKVKNVTIVLFKRCLIFIQT